MATSAPAASEPGGVFEPLERLATGRGGPLLVALWAVAEAILLPVVPDVALDLLALAAPRRTPLLFAILIAGSLVGTAALYAMARAAPDAVASLVLALPGVGPAMLAEAQRLVAPGDPLAIAQLGPGTPLKVYTLAWATGPATPLPLLLGTILNRLTRIGPMLALAAGAGWLAPRLIRRHGRLIVAGYAALWVVGYALYLR